MDTSSIGIGKKFFSKRLMCYDQVMIKPRLRYLRRHFNIKEIAKILKAQIVSIMTYGAPAWYHRIDYPSRLELRSTYYHIIRVMLRDFKRNLNRNGLLKASGMENLDNILSIRESLVLSSN